MKYTIKIEEEWERCGPYDSGEVLETYYRVINKAGKPLERYWTEYKAKRAIEQLQRRYKKKVKK